MKQVLILGAGALGSWLASHLAIDLKDKVEITVLDFDKVEPRNWLAGTQFYRSEQRERTKTQSLAFNIYKWLGIGINTIEAQISKDNLNLLKNFDLIIDTFDNFDSRQLVHKHCQQEKLPCLHVGFSPERTFEIMWNKNYQVPSDRKGDFDICTAEGARSFVHLVSALASLVVQDYIQNGKRREFVGSRLSLAEIL